MFPGARMVRADLITWCSAVHLAALSGWGGREAACVWQGTVLLGVSQGDGSGSRPGSPASPALAHGAEDVCETRMKC